MDEKQKIIKQGRAANVFSPGAPVDKYRLFAGRTKQVRKVLNAASQRGQHAILHGERGVGKTSLANVLAEVLQETGPVQSLRSGTVNCHGKDDFSSLWRKVLKEMSFQYKRRGMGFAPQEEENQVSLDQMIPEEAAPEDIRRLLESFAQNAIIVIDELDRLEDEKATVLLSDLIKTLSDHSVATTIVLVGVADSVDELIQGHRSIERALVQVHVPRMSSDELEEIIDKGLQELEMEIAGAAKRRIVRFSQGLPHYTHLLALQAAQNAIERESEKIDMEEIDLAIKDALEETQRSIIQTYHEATSSARKKTLFAPVLMACALASTDDLGYFRAADVRKPLSAIMDREYDIPAFSRHLNDFSEDRGPVLQKRGEPRNYRFRFINPLMQPYVVMQGYAKGRISKDIIDSSEYSF